MVVVAAPVLVIFSLRFVLLCVEDIISPKGKYGIDQEPKALVSLTRYM